MTIILGIALCLMSVFLPSTTFALEPSIIGQDGVEMLLVPEGEFIMGLSDKEPGSSENPLKKIYLKAYYIDKYEITNSQYKRCVASGFCKDPSLIIDYPRSVHEDGKSWYKDKTMGEYPVVGLTWRQAGIYCQWAGERLPTTAEWEKAARGTTGLKYPWGNVWDGKKANWDDSGKLDGYKKIAPIGRFPEGASPYGVMDMAGNVREWVDNLILKGGSWYSDQVSLRCGDPGHGYIVERDDDMGFRCLKDVP